MPDAAVSLWANVPHYISEVSNPHAVRALVRRVLDLWIGRRACPSWTRRRRSSTGNSPDHGAEAGSGEVCPGTGRATGAGEAAEELPADELPSAAELIREAEQFLRRQQERRRLPDGAREGRDALRDVKALARFSSEKLQKVPLFESARFFCDLYCLAAGQAQRVHSHADSDKVYCVLSGRATIQVGAEEAETVRCRRARPRRRAPWGGEPDGRAVTVAGLHGAEAGARVDD